MRLIKVTDDDGYVYYQIEKIHAGRVFAFRHVATPFCERWQTAQILWNIRKRIREYIGAINNG